MYNLSKNKDSTSKLLKEPTALELPDRRWGLISTDLIVDVPRNRRSFDSITTLVDILSRRVHFVPSICDDRTVDTEKLFFTSMFVQNGLPDAITSDGDPKFLSKVWEELMKLCGNRLKMSSSRHPKTDGES